MSFAAVDNLIAYFEQIKATIAFLSLSDIFPDIRVEHPLYKPPLSSTHCQPTSTSNKVS